MRRLLVLALTLAISHMPFALSASSANETDEDVRLGGISASLQPDLFTGTLTGRIPIEVPPGRNGMQPNLALSYTSSGGNSWTGMGWKLEVGTIERQTRWGVLYSPTTQEELEGKVYTMRLNGLSTDLVPDATDPLLYHEKFKTGFLRIKKLSADGTAGWEVTDTKGTKYTFGATERVESGTLIFKWCLEKVVDRDGNYLTVLYYPPTNGQYYLSQLQYGGNDGTGGGAVLAHTKTVKFWLENRTDAPAMYTSNFLITTAKRLKTMEVKVNGLLQRAYQLCYLDSAAPCPITGISASRSFLSSIQQVGKDATVNQTDGTITGGTLSPQVNVGYDLSSSEGTFAPFNATTHTTVAQSTLWVPSLVDVNGDGRADAVITLADTVGWQTSVALGNGDGTFAQYHYNQHDAAAYDPLWQKRMVDVNGDGKADAVVTYLGPSGWKTRVALANGTNTFATPFKETIHTTVPQSSTLWVPSLVDVNGDGYADAVITLADTVGWQTSVALGNGDGTFAQYHYSQHDAAAYDPLWQKRMVDVNGDGKADAVVTYLGPSGWKTRVALANGTNTFATPFKETIHTTVPQSSTLWVPSLVDVNGDGRADAVITLADTVGWQTSVALGTSDGTFEQFRYNQHDATAYPSGWQPTMADVNGDGKADAVVTYLGSSGWKTRVVLANGADTFATPFKETIHAVTAYTSTWKPSMADVDGDGKADAVVNYVNNSAPNGWFTHVDLALGGMQLLTSLANGLGGATTIQYLPSTQYVNTQLPFPVKTVSSLTTCDNWDRVNKICAPTGIASTTTYSYTGGYHHIGERDFRGFKTAVVTSPGLTDADKTVTTIWFHQGTELAPVDTENPGLANGYMKGKPYRVEVRRKSDNYLFSKTETTYLADLMGSASAAPWFNPPAQVDSTIENGAKTTRVLYADAGFTGYDTYGNVTQVRSLGDISTSTDDSTRVVTFGNANTTTWQVSLPSIDSTYAGLGAAGTKLAETKYFYDGASSCTTPDGNLIPTKGHVTKVERYLDQGGTNPISGMQYNSYGSLTCTRDPNGNTTNLTYDLLTSTFPLTSTNPLPVVLVTTMTYYGVNGVAMDTGLYGQAKSVTDPNAKTTTSTYDALGRSLTTATADGLVNTMAYNYGGTFVVGTQNIQSTTSGGGLSANLVSKTYFDGLGRTIKTESPGAADGGASLKVLVTETQYDSRGLVKQTSLPYIQGSESATGRWTVMTYDALGRTTQVTPPDNAYSRLCYNAWTTTTIDPKRHKKVETKDVLGRLVTVQEYTGTQVDCTTTSGTLYATTSYAYNLVGNLLSVTDAKGNVSTMTYDTLGRKLTMHDPDMGNWAYTYDSNGNLKTQIDAKSQKLCFDYDALNRRTQKNYGTTTVACGTNTVVYTYDDTVAANNGKGRLKQVTDPAQSVTFQYDSRGRITQSAKTLDGTSYTTTSAYDGLGRLTTVNYPTTPIKTVTYSYDGPQLKSVLEGATTYVIYAGWNALGQAATATFGNGVVTTMTYANTNNTTCPQQTFRLCTLKTQKGANPLYQDLRYTIDNVENVQNIYDATVANGAGDQVFGYDDLDRLTLANGPYGASGTNASLTYTYDEIGNLTKNSQLSATNYTYPASGASSVRPHAVSTAGTNSYTYDLNGNMLTGAGRTYTWNQENKPLTVVQGGTTTTFIYDGDGGRVKKVVGSTTTRYISRLYECDNTACSRYVWAGDTRIATVASNGTVYYWHGDHLGSSSVITDDTGAKVEAITYYPYGATRTDLPGTPVNVPYKYTGQELDASTGLYDYGARHYDPVLARFTSPDTIITDPSNPQDFNRYSYVQNNPLNATDPSGHHTVNEVKNMPNIRLLLTDWSVGGCLCLEDAQILVNTGRITLSQYISFLPLYHGCFGVGCNSDDDMLHIDGIAPFVSPWGGNRLAEFEKLAQSNPKPTPTPTSPPSPPPASKPTPVPTALMPVVPPPAPLPLEDPLLGPGDLGGIGSALKAVAVSATKIASVAAKQALGNVKFPSTKELARRLGIGENEVHEIKNSITVDLKDLHGMKNPDIGLDKAGSIALRDRITGRTVQTDVPLATYGSKK